MSTKAWTALALLAAAVVLQWMAYSAAQSLLVLDLMQWGHSGASAGRLLSLLTTFTFLASLLAGALAFAIGPRATAAIGCLVAAIGLAVLALDKGGEVGTLLLGIGAGIFWPC